MVLADKKVHEEIFENPRIALLHYSNKWNNFPELGFRYISVKQ